MISIRNVALLGANGNLGSTILSELVIAGFNVTVLRRESSKSSTSDYPSAVTVTSIPDDFQSNDLLEALRGQHAVIACIKGSQTKVQQQLAEAAAKVGVSRFIPADFGSCDSQSEYTQRLVPLYRHKTEMREYLQELTKIHPDFSWTSLVPGHFFDWSLEFNHIFLSERRADVLDDGETKFSITTLKRIGEATARILQRPEETRNKILYVQSFRVTQTEVVAAYERATGGGSWKVVKHDSKEFEREEKAKADAGDLDAVENLVWLLGTIDADWSLRDGYAMDLLSLEDENLDLVVRETVKRFQ